MLPIDMFYRPLRRVTGYIGGGQAPASFEKTLTEYLAETEYSVVVADLKRHFLRKRKPTVFNCNQPLSERSSKGPAQKTPPESGKG